MGVFRSTGAVEALRAAGIMAERAVQILGCSSSEWSTVTHHTGKAHEQLHAAVAALAGLTRHDLWPELYGPDDALLSGARLYEPAAKRPANAPLASHAEIVARLQARGLGAAVRLVPVLDCTRAGLRLASIRLKSPEPM